MSYSDSGARVGVGVGELFTKTYIYIYIMSYSDSGARVGVGAGELFTIIYIYIMSYSDSGAWVIYIYYVLF